MPGRDKALAAGIMGNFMLPFGMFRPVYFVQ